LDNFASFEFVASQLVNCSRALRRFNMFLMLGGTTEKRGSHSAKD